MNNDDRRKREAYLISLEQKINHVSIEILKYIKIFLQMMLAEKNNTHLIKENSNALIERYKIKIFIYNKVAKFIQLLPEIKHI